MIRLPLSYREEQNWNSSSEPTLLKGTYPNSSSSVFIKWFKYTNIIYLYVSGLASAIDVMQPLLIKEGVLAKEYNIMYKMVFLLFFIALFNYTFYENFVLSSNINFDEFGFVKRIKRIPINIHNIGSTTFFV